MWAWGGYHVPMVPVPMVPSPGFQGQMAALAGEGVSWTIDLQNQGVFWLTEPPCCWLKIVALQTPLTSPGSQEASATEATDYGQGKGAVSSSGEGGGWLQWGWTRGLPWGTPMGGRPINPLLMLPPCCLGTEASKKEEVPGSPNDSPETMSLVPWDHQGRRVLYHGIAGAVLTQAVQTVTWALISLQRRGWAQEPSPWRSSHSFCSAHWLSPWQVCAGVSLARLSRSWWLLLPCPPFQGPWHQWWSCPKCLLPWMPWSGGWQPWRLTTKPWKAVPPLRWLSDSPPPLQALCPCIEALKH